MEKVTVIKSGTGKNGQKYTLSRVVDENKVVYVTFAGSHFEAGGIYHITFVVEKKGQFTQRRILTATPVGPREDDSDVPS